MTCALCPECDGTTEGDVRDGPLRYCTYCGYEFGGDDDHVSHDALAACSPAVDWHPQGEHSSTPDFVGGEYE